MALKTRIKAGGAVAALFVTFVGAWEGLRTTAYRDVVGVPTICYGETRGVKMGDKKSPEECKRILVEHSDPYAKAIESCVKVPLPDKRYVALVSLAYNVGPVTACNSTAVRLLNQGRTQEGCDALLMYSKAGGRTIPGLLNRRKAERELCLAN